MNIPAQLLPHKHIRFCESLIGLAGCIRQLLDKPRTVDDLYSILNAPNSAWLYKPSFEQVVSAVVILFAIGQITETDNNKLHIIEKPLNKSNSLEAQQVSHEKNQFVATQPELSEGFGQS